MTEKVEKEGREKVKRECEKSGVRKWRKIGVRNHCEKVEIENRIVKRKWRGN